jgi:site-specific recombinase XerC
MNAITREELSELTPACKLVMSEESGFTAGKLACEANSHFVLVQLTCERYVPLTDEAETLLEENGLPLLDEADVEAIIWPKASKRPSSRLKALQARANELAQVQSRKQVASRKRTARKARQTQDAEA